jgi:hypothetical protein
MAAVGQPAAAVPDAHLCASPRAAVAPHPECEGGYLSDGNTLGVGPAAEDTGERQVCDVGARRDDAPDTVVVLQLVPAIGCHRSAGRIMVVERQVPSHLRIEPDLETLLVY